MNNFATWLNEKLEELGWSQNELARRAGISQSQVSNVINGYKPGPNFIEGIARAFSMTNRDVYERAGKIEPWPPENDPSMKAIREIASQLTYEERIVFVEQMRAVKKLRESRGDYKDKDANAAKPGDAPHHSK